MPILHEITCLYKKLHVIRNQIPKADRLGLYSKIENSVLNSLELSLQAALHERENKSPLVKQLKIQIEISKHLIRLSWELEMISHKKYLILQEKLQTISKMTAGWIGYLNKEP